MIQTYFRYTIILFHVLSHPSREIAAYSYCRFRAKTIICDQNLHKCILLTKSMRIYGLFVDKNAKLQRYSFCTLFPRIPISQFVFSFFSSGHLFLNTIKHVLYLVWSFTLFMFYPPPLYIPVCLRLSVYSCVPALPLYSR